MTEENVVSYQRFVVRKEGDSIVRGIERTDMPELVDRHVRLRGTYSSLNFKDALACEGHPGVVKHLPQVPGIDCIGTVVESRSDLWQVGDRVIVGQAKFGTECPGGWSEWVQIPEDWMIALPNGLNELEAIALGTAGFTAAGCVEALVRNQLVPEDGDVVVTGATGGVGIFAVKLLAKLGYRVVASSGKPEQAQWLLDQGAAEVIPREAMVDQSERPLLKGRWAGGVDTVGGETLATLVRSTQIGGAISACGVVGGSELPLTVYPFILRGVTLCGIDSANTSNQDRTSLWNKLAGDWKLDDLSDLTRVVNLEQIETEVQTILQGKLTGRVVLDLDV